MGSTEFPYTLANVEDRNRENPDTFQIDSRSKRESLFVGDLAKGVFEGPDGGDRMWLRILKPASRFRYRGQLLNSPVCVDGIAAGDIIEFGPEHICDYEKEPRGGVYDPGFLT